MYKVANGSVTIILDGLVIVFLGFFQLPNMAGAGAGGGVSTTTEGGGVSTTTAGGGVSIGTGCLTGSDVARVVFTAREVTVSV